MSKVYKFGGASVQDANAVKHLYNLLRTEQNSALLIVISAMGKTTNKLEKLVDAYFYKKENAFDVLEEIKAFHYTILNDLFQNKNHAVYTAIDNLLVEIEWAIEDEPTGSYDFEYDQIVALGEMLSTTVVSAYLSDQGIKNRWLDARDIIKTDNSHRIASIDWELSYQAIDPLDTNGIIITQGFIGITSENFNTTLGREGSDFSAAVFAYLTNADSVTIWKDVPGLLNADPKWFDDTIKLDHISYHEAVELAYYGATIIHPKTIKPLQNKKIPLWIKSFVNPTEKGTLIDSDDSDDDKITSYIFKVDQVLISISAKDYSFIIEKNLEEIFKLFSEIGITINLMQNSAISFSTCVDNDKLKLPQLINELQRSFQVLYNTNLELVTIRHYNQKILDKVTTDKAILVEQKSRVTARIVMRNKMD